MVRYGDGIRVTASKGDERVFDQVLFAIGRAPNTRELGLEACGSALGRNGQIPVEVYCQSFKPMRSAFAGRGIDDHA